MIGAGPAIFGDLETISAIPARADMEARPPSEVAGDMERTRLTR